MNNILRKEIGFFTIEAKKESHHVDFTIYKGTGYLESFDPEGGSNHEHNPFIKGYVKWDGCSNWDFPLGEGITHPLHFCDLKEIKSFCDMLSELYKWSAELMPENKEMILD